MQGLGPAILRPRTLLAAAALIAALVGSAHDLRAAELYQLRDGEILQFTGAHCSPAGRCPGWRSLDNDRSNRQIASAAGQLYKRQDDGSIWRHSDRGWQRLENIRGTQTITGGGSRLYQHAADGSIWQYQPGLVERAKDVTPCTGSGCWLRLDNNRRTTAIAAAGNRLFQLHDNGAIWEYTGVPCAGSSCRGWQLIDNNRHTIAIVAGKGGLFQLHDNGAIWEYTGTRSWALLYHGESIRAVAADADRLFQLRGDGSVWEHTRPACEGSSCWERIDSNPGNREIAAGGGLLFQRRYDGSIWQQSEQLDNDPGTRAIVVADRPYAACPIGWQPSVFAPVFYGIRHYGVKQGAPRAVRVFFPSIDGAVRDAPILEGCGRYPLILFVHGNCDEPRHFQTWLRLPELLARSGYVVAVPDAQDETTSDPWTGSYAGLADVISWMRGSWEHRSSLLSATGIIGHSRGAILAARLASAGRIAGYASLSGVWLEAPPSYPIPVLSSLAIPKIFVWGSGGDAPFAELLRDRDSRHPTVDTNIWDTIIHPKHKLSFAGAEHWDYLPENCPTAASAPRGACNNVGELNAEILLAFFAKYLPPERWPELRTRVSNNLLPSYPPLTERQRFFDAAHPARQSRVAELRRGGACAMTLEWTSSGRDTGSTHLPP
jgi:hypothetical protein